MAAQADSAPSAGGAELNWLWRIALVGGLTIVVVLVWALRDSTPPIAAPPIAALPVADPALARNAPTVPAARAAPPAAEPASQPAFAQTATAAQPPQPIAESAPTIEWPKQSGIIPGRPDPIPPPRPAAFERYIVQRGETLVLIAALRGLDLDDLLIFNPELGDGAALHAGADIWIPIWEAADHDPP